MKLLCYFIVGLILLQLVMGRCPIPDAKADGDECSEDHDCSFPSFCLNGICTIQPRTESKCKNMTDCSPNITGMSCIAAKCIATSMNGERCDQYNCNSLSECNEGYCGNARCFQQKDCGFGYYCNKETSTCERTNQTCEIDYNCGFSGVCVNGKCYEKYALSLGEKCYKTEQCNIFAGYMCDPAAKKCVKHEAYGKSCYVDGECGGGICRCNKDNQDICYGFNGALTDNHCLRSHQAIQRCIDDNRCSRILPFTCDKCYNKYICFISTCFADKLYDPHYKKVAETCGVPNEQVGSEIIPEEEKNGVKTDTNSNHSSVLGAPLLLVSILSVVIATLI